jgi:hypothetical protein
MWATKNYLGGRFIKAIVSRDLSVHIDCNFYFHHDVDLFLYAIQF